MHAPSKFGVVLAAVAVALVAGIGDADAKKKKRKPAPPRCVATLEGSATSTGILGQGSAMARVAAKADWEAKASSIYGAKYGNYSKARSVKWDCKKGAILLAKCVVTAKPCR